MKWLVALLALLLGGCGTASSGVVLDVWAMGREGEVVGRLVPEFEAENPGITVRIQQLPFSAAHEKLLTGFVGDAMPDMAQLGNSWVPEFAALGALEPLDSRVAATSAIPRGDYFPGVWDSNLVDGRLYGVPWYVDTRLLFYRRDILKRVGYDHPPRDWAEWRAQMVAIKKVVGPGKYAAYFPLNEYEPLEILALQSPNPMVRAGARGNFRSPGFKRALDFYLATMRDGLAPVAASTDIANVWDEFDRGFFSFYITGPWQIGEFQRRLPAAHQSEWMTAPMPGPDGPGLSNAGGSSLVLFKSSTHKDAAWRLVAFLSRPDIQVRFHALTGDLPPRISVWRTKALANDPYARAFGDQMQRLRATPKVPEWERIGTEIKTIGEKAAHGELTVDQAAAALDARADEILAKRRWMLARRHQ
ncbi:sugar ABC transporter substrate-binding protein [Sphingomonas sp.]|jgi:multiple sugar transport system substrate-binding protein|uniref:sugar ABC transporter substrate-binding protein n=1 Tax=Sphingomonas sp. TaxID=28214 RepID=UPI002E2F065B|nr:sugar ABC transporter substrate-binding protein [Sphingomonas sp.]HEX4695627.1 sugar ABC transporter substrate-binding protein [Sphingomonas sp.]